MNIQEKHGFDWLQHNQHIKYTKPPECVDII